MSGDLKASEGGILVRCLAPKLQMKLILDDVGNIPFYFRRIEPLLPLLDENMLVLQSPSYRSMLRLTFSLQLEVARIFDPLGDVAPKIYSAVARSENDPTSWGKITMGGSLEMVDAHNPNIEVPPPIGQALALYANPCNQEWAKGPEDFIELFLTAVLMLNNRRKLNEAHLPPKSITAC